MTLQRFDFARRQPRRAPNARFDKSEERVKRLKLLAVVAVVWVLVVAGRLVSLQINQRGQWEKWATKQHETGLTIAAERGPIYDRDNRLLAVSVPAASLYLRPQVLLASLKHENSPKDLRSTILATLVRELGGTPKEYEKLFQSKSPFVWIRRQMPREAAERLVNFNLPGIGSVLETKRYYPYNHAASTVIGRVGLDGNGLSGLEKRFDRLLDKGAHKWSVARDALGNLIHEASDTGSFELPRGQTLQVTLDAEIQTILDDELEQGRARANAKAALGVMINARTGEILALGQSPMPNFNLPVEATGNALRNLVAETVLEPGSIMKPLVVAAALQRGTVRASDLINCENGRYRVGKHTVKDVHPSATISVSDVVVRSSNIGMTKIGFMMGKENLYQSLRLLGFGTASGLNLPGESSGIFRNVSNWATIDVATHSFGQGIAVTPLQVVRAVGSLINGGVMMPLRLVENSTPLTKPTRIFSESVAKQVSQMMVDVVEDEEHGTGSKARLEGVRIGGKTGTAQKARTGGKGYQSGAYTASFVGFIDAQELGVADPLVLLVMVDEPRTDTIYGGMLAAPVFQKITQRTLKYLTMQRTQPRGLESESVPSPVSPAAPGRSPIRPVRAAPDVVIASDGRNA
jgi:cell division protein FtsI (penicillin-binding protein 3)